MKCTTREFITSTQDGKEVKIIATYVSELTVDPFLTNYPFAKRNYISTARSSMAAYVEGQRIGRVCYDPNFWHLIDIREKPGAKKIWGLPIGFADPQQIDAYNAFLRDLMQDDEEVIAFRAAEKAKKDAEEYERYMKIIKACERGFLVETPEEAQRLQKQWNDLHNEGGYGYVPTWYPRSVYEDALAYVAKYKESES